MKQNEFPFPELKEAMEADNRPTAHAGRNAVQEIGRGKLLLIEDLTGA